MNSTNPSFNMVTKTKNRKRNKFENLLHPPRRVSSRGNRGVPPDRYSPPDTRRLSAMISSLGASQSELSREEWRQPITKELKSHLDFQTWETIEKTSVPTNHKILPSVWSLKVKRDGTLKA